MTSNELSPTHWSWGEVCALLRTLLLPTLRGSPPPFFRLGNCVKIRIICTALAIAFASSIYFRQNK